MPRFQRVGRVVAIVVMTTAKKLLPSLAAATLAVAFTGSASAHVSIVSGVGTANATQEITFGVGHGCAGADTWRVRVQIPPNVTGVRPLPTDFGKATVEKDATGAVIAVTWQKADAEVLDDDSHYYKLVVRARMPDQPFTTFYFPAAQTCRAKDGQLTTVNWSLVPPLPDGGVDEPAPELRLLPARRAGWNKWTVTQELTNLAAFFGDALIVWRGNSAYSANPVTAELATATAGVATLSSVSPNDQIWVRY